MPKQIIVVDDNKEVREIVTFVLQRYGYRVTCAANGKQLQQVLDLCTGEPPALLILDVMMPGEDGYHIFHQLRTDENTRQIPVMIITAHAEEIYQRISRDLGAVLHMTKPFHPLALAERVKEIVEQE